MSQFMPWIVAGVLVIGGSALGFFVYRRGRAPQRPDYLKRYAEHVMSACIQARSPDPIIAAIVQKYQDPQKVDSITWGELFTVESHLLSSQSEPVLRRRAWLRWSSATRSPPSLVVFLSARPARLGGWRHALLP